MLSSYSSTVRGNWIMEAMQEVIYVLGRSVIHYELPDVNMIDIN